MSMELIIAIVAGLLVVTGLLFLSMIHLFMIPKDVMERDTARRAERERESPGASPRRPEPEIPHHPKPEPEVEKTPPQPEVEREPGQTVDPKPDAEPPPRKED